LSDVRREDVKIITGSVHDEDPAKIKAFADASLAGVEVAGRQRFYRLRTKWSWIIFGWVTFLIFFNSAVTVLVGCGLLDFTQYEWFVTAITVETFLQIVGMGYVAVNFLFSHHASSVKTNQPSPEAP
jgi:hypothetical protein